jgi:hypothetical protein
MGNLPIFAKTQSPFEILPLSSALPQDYCARNAE